MGLFDFVRDKLSSIGGAISAGVRKVGDFVTSKQKIGQVTSVVRKVANFVSPFVGMLPPKFRGPAQAIVDGAKTAASVVDSGTEWLHKAGAIRD